MNTIQLECFISVAQHLNFSRASEELKITQPAVTHQIRSLEEELGVRLFRRTSKSVSLTPEGLLFLPDAELILKTAISAKDRLGSHEHIIPFEIGCHNHAEMNLLPPVFQILLQEFPTLHPSVSLIPFPSLFMMVENRNIHAAFGIKEGQIKSSLAFKELYTAPVACVCAPNHPLAQYSVLKKDQLAGNIIVCSPRQIPHSLYAVQSPLLTSLSAHQRHFTETMESALTLAKSLAGYTLCPAIPAMEDPALCYVPISDLEPLSFGVFYRQDNDHPVMKRFLTLLSETKS